MIRRSFLGALLGAPALAKAAVEHGMSQMAGMPTPTSGRIAEIVDGDEPEGPSFADLRAEALQERIEGSIKRRMGAIHAPHMPSRIAEKKSWSSAFKESVWVHDQRRRQKDLNRLRSAMRIDDPTLRWVALARLAAERGVNTPTDEEVENQRANFGSDW